MSYWKYLLNVLLKNKLNFIPLAILFAAAIFLLSANSRTADQNSFVGDIKRNQAIIEQQLAQREEQLADQKNLDKEELADLRKSSAMLEKERNKNQAMIDFASKKQWNKAYELKLAIIDDLLLRVESGDIAPEDNSDFIEHLNNEKTLYTKLQKLNLAVDPINLETKGFTFTYRMQAVLIPLIFTICLIALLVNLFYNGYVNGIFIERMFPRPQINLQLSKIAFGFTQGALLYLLFLLTNFLLASVTNGTSSPAYPLILATDSDVTLAVGAAISQAALLHLLGIFFLTCVIYLLVSVTKNRLATMLVATLGLGGLILMTGQFAPLNSILHVLPTTYFNAAQVVTDELALATQNTQINLLSGLLVLVISNLLLLTAIIFLNQKAERHQLLYQKR